MANSDYDREREIDEIGRDKVAANNKKHAMNVTKRKEELAKKVKNDGFDGNKRWGNSAIKGHGANSPAMMEARKKFGK